METRLLLPMTNVAMADHSTNVARSAVMVSFPQSQITQDAAGRLLTIQEPRFVVETRLLLPMTNVAMADHSTNVARYVVMVSFPQSQKTQDAARRLLTIQEPRFAVEVKLLLPMTNVVMADHSTNVARSAVMVSFLQSQITQDAAGRLLTIQEPRFAVGVKLLVPMANVVMADHLTNVARSAVTVSFPKSYETQGVVGRWRTIQEPRFVVETRLLLPMTNVAMAHHSTNVARSAVMVSFPQSQKTQDAAGRLLTIQEPRFVVETRLLLPMTNVAMAHHSTNVARSAVMVSFPQSQKTQDAAGRLLTIQEPRFVVETRLLLPMTNVAMADHSTNVARSAVMVSFP